jgi:hypothetical protein
MYIQIFLTCLIVALLSFFIIGLDIAQKAPLFLNGLISVVFLSSIIGLPVSILLWIWA